MERRGWQEFIVRRKRWVNICESCM